MSISKENFVKIGIVGVGGAGNNVVNRMYDEDIQLVDYISIHTDDNGYKKAKAEKKIQIGLKSTYGLGAGGNPEVGRRAVEENIKEITEMIKGYDMLFITAGMGGGTGTGASPVIAEIAKELGILTVGVVTKPFAFEGKKKLQMAENGIEELKKSVDSMIVIPNENLFNLIPNSVTMLNAFKIVDSVLVDTVKNIVEVIQKPTMINCDFADISAILKNSGFMHTATGCADGNERTEKVIEQIKKNMLLGTSVEGASSALLCISSDTLNLQEVNLIASAITDISDKDINMILGVNTDDNMGDELKAVLISTKKING